MTIGEREIANRSRNFYNGEMRTSRTTSILVLLLLAFSFAACSGNNGGNSNAAAPNGKRNETRNAPANVQDDAENLAKIIKLPRLPEETTYAEINLNAPEEKRLVAVMKFSAEDVAEICAAAERHKPSVPSEIDAEMWFPPELVAKSQESGDESLKGIEYAADDFIQPPYANGKLRRVNDTDYFVLELTSF